jgi:hypothetical protein
MTDDTLLPLDLPVVRRKKLTVDFEGGNQSSNGGALLLPESGLMSVCAGGSRDPRRSGSNMRLRFQMARSGGDRTTS